MSAQAASVSNVPLFTAQEIDDILGAHLARKRPERVFQKLIIDDWQLSSIGGAPAGFLSQQLRLTVTFHDDIDGADQAAPVVATFFVKTLSTGSAAQTEYVTDYGAFDKEIRLYSHLLPTLIRITGDDVTGAFAPHCYFGRGPNLLVFEDLQCDSFRNCAGRDGLLDMQHLLLTVETLARVHGACIIFEKQQNQTVTASYPEHLTENAYPDRSSSTAGGKPSRHAWIANTIRTLVALFGEIPEFRDSHHLVGERIAKTLAQIYEFVLPSRRFRNCFGHGDLWKNNVMFKYAELAEIGQPINGDTVVLPVEAKFVDFQLARYAPPALDLMTICMMVTSRQFRNVHLQLILDAYYTYLEFFLRQHDLCVTVELPRDEFDESCRHYRLAGLIECCLFSHMTLLPADVAANITRNGFGAFMGAARVETCLLAFRKDALYRERMTDMLVSLVDEFIVGRK